MLHLRGTSKHVLRVVPCSTAPSPGVHPRLALLLARSLAPRPLARLLVLVLVRLLARRPAVADLRRSTPAVISVGAGDHAGRPGRGQASVRTFRHSHRLRPSCMPHTAHARTRCDAAPRLAVFSPAASLVATADAISSSTALPARTPADEASLGPEPSPDNASHCSRAALSSEVETSVWP